MGFWKDNFFPWDARLQIQIPGSVDIVMCLSCAHHVSQEESVPMVALRTLLEEKDIHVALSVEASGTFVR